MGGILVSYHNTFKIFGFEYISTAQMETILFGSPDMGAHLFSLSLQMLNNILNVCADRFPEQDMELLFTKPKIGTTTLLVAPKVAKEGQTPFHFDISLVSTIDEKVQASPIFTEGQKWDVEMEIVEQEYDPAFHERKQKHHDELYTIGNFGSTRFVEQLKLEVLENKYARG